MIKRLIAALVLLLSVQVAHAQLTGSVLNNLPAASSVNDSDLFFDVQGTNADRKALGSQISAYVFGKVSGSCTSNSSGVFSCAGGVSSVFGRTGTVTAQSGDYSFSLLSGSATIGQLGVPSCAADGVHGLTNPAGGGFSCTSISGGSGTVTSVGAACGTTTFGAAITTTGVIASVEQVNAQGGTSYAIANGDCGFLTNFSSASAIAVSLAAPSGSNFVNGWYNDLCAIGAGTATITPSGATIGGSSTLAIASGTCARVVSDGTNYQVIKSGSGGGGAVSSVSNSDGTLTISPTTGAVVASLALGHANTWTAIQTFTNSDINLLGSSSGATTFTSANAGASNFTATFPANTGTLAELNLAQTWSAAQTVNSGDLLLAGSVSGSTTLNAAATASGTLTLPAATDTLIARATTDTLTNKTYDTAGSGNVFKINGTSITAISGNTGTVGTTSGAFTSGNCVKSDVSHNFVDAGTTCGGGGTPGGANTDVQFNSSSAFGGDSGFTYAGNGQATLALGTITANAKALNITATLNNSGITFDAPLFMSITNTASAGASALFDFQLSTGGHSGSFLSANPDGSVFVNQIGSALTVQAFTVQFRGSSEFQVDDSGNLSIYGNLNIQTNTQKINFGGASQIVGDGSNGVNILQNTSANALRVYNTTDSNTSPTNYERGVFDWTTATNTLTIGPQAGGTGTLRYMKQTVAFAAPAPTTKTSAYSQAVTDQDLIFNGTGSITLTLLSASSFPGLTLWVRTIAAQPVVSASSNVVPLAGGAAGTAILLGTAGKWAKLVSDGTNWQIMASN